jgi:hypothetical protein
MVESSVLNHLLELSTTVVLQPVAGAALTLVEATNTVAGNTIAKAIKITSIVFRFPNFLPPFHPLKMRSPNRNPRTRLAENR